MLCSTTFLPDDNVVKIAKAKYVSLRGTSEKLIFNITYSKMMTASVV
jgi:hypothetical protein